MDPRHLFFDDRLKGHCSYCGSKPSTRDHVPSKVLLDEPYPTSLPVVEACQECNQGFSLDEQYLACLIECVLAGSTDPEKVCRPKIKRILQEQSALQAKLTKSMIVDAVGHVHWKPDVERIESIILKLARGHRSYELSYWWGSPEEVWFSPLCFLSQSEIEAFESSSLAGKQVWPEIGTRAFRKTVVMLDPIRKEPYLIHPNWIIVQPGRYRYSVEESDRVTVKMVLSEYLACLVTWRV